MPRKRDVFTPPEISMVTSHKVSCNGGGGALGRGVAGEPVRESFRTQRIGKRPGLVRRFLRNQPGGVPLMAYTEAQLQALETALAKGEHRVSFGDKTVEYRSVDELKAAIREVKRGILEQAAATGLWPGAPRQIRVTTSKGF